MDSRNPVVRTPNMDFGDMNVDTNIKVNPSNPFSQPNQGMQSNNTFGQPNQDVKNQAGFITQPGNNDKDIEEPKPKFRLAGEENVSTQNGFRSNYNNSFNNSFDNSSLNGTYSNTNYTDTYSDVDNTDLDKAMNSIPGFKNSRYQQALNTYDHDTPHAKETRY